MVSDDQNNVVYIHKMNIEKYRRILDTYLTDEERHFVKRRLNEEKVALEQLPGTIPQ